MRCEVREIFDGDEWFLRKGITNSRTLTNALTVSNKPMRELTRESVRHQERDHSSEELLARFEKHMIESALSQTTITNYLVDMRAFTRWYAENNGGMFFPQSLNVSDIRDYRLYLQRVEGRAPSTINRRLQGIRRFCRFAIEAGLMRSNPAVEVDLLRGEDPSPPRALDPAEIEGLMRVVNGGRPSLVKRDRAIIQVLLQTGIKVGELVELRLSDIEISGDGGILTVRGDGESREIPLNVVTCDALREYLFVRPRLPGIEHLFLSQEGRPISTRSVQRLVSTYAKAAGLEGVSAQALRRTYIQLLDCSTTSEILNRRDE